MICTSCGKQINDVGKFCPYCGKEQSFSEAKSIYLEGVEIFNRGNYIEAKKYFEKSSSLGFPPATNHVN